MSGELVFNQILALKYYIIVCVINTIIINTISSIMVFNNTVIVRTGIVTIACVQCLTHVLPLCSQLIDSAFDSPQLSPFNAKGPLCLSPSFQMSTLSLPGQAPSPLQSPILNEVGTARLEEEEEGRRKVR